MINRSIVEAHDGRIWASSATAAGLTMHVELPSAARSGASFDGTKV